MCENWRCEAWDSADRTGPMKLQHLSVNSAAAVESALNPITQVLASLAKMLRTVEAWFNGEAGSAHRASKAEEGFSDAKHHEHVVDVLLATWTDQDASDRVGAIEIIKALYPWYSTRPQEAFCRITAIGTMRVQSETAVAQAEGVGGNALLMDRESGGFGILASGEEIVARSCGIMARAARPTLKGLKRSCKNSTL